MAASPPDLVAEKPQPSAWSGLAGITVAVGILLFTQYVVFLGFIGVGLAIVAAIAIIRTDPFGGREPHAAELPPPRPR